MYSPRYEPVSISSLASNKSSGIPTSSSADEDERYWQASPLSRKAEPVSTWPANPQSPPSDENLSSMLTKPTNTPSPTQKISVLFVLFVMVGLGAIYTSRETVYSTAAHVATFEVNRQRLDEELVKAEKELNKMKRELTAMDIMIQKQLGKDAKGRGKTVSNYRAMHEMKTLQGRLRERSKLSRSLKERVQKTSRVNILQKYGPGPHRVEVILIFTGEEKKQGPTRFVLEVAPIDVMPHSAETFLEMVSTGLLNGCSFILNALHVIKAAPLPYDGSSAAAKAKAFSDQGLESVAFKEYSDQYPHKAYTVGFAADGSPSFYINTEDNTEIHAGDPCFATVVEGIETIKRMEKSPTRNAIWYENRIGIKSARIMKPDEELVATPNQKGGSKVRATKTN